MTADAFILTLSCPDRAGIVHAVTGVLAAQGGNISEAAQFNDQGTGLFFMRVRFAAPGATVASLSAPLAELAGTLAMKWQLHGALERLPTVILVSKLGHCLNDLLFRYRSQLVPLDIRAIVSNHRDYYQLSASYDIPFHHIPVTAATKPQAEARLLEIVNAEKAELVVLARYMQVLSDDLCRALVGRAINIHHSFLPSFKGAKPYWQAHERGVKIIGATAHFVTEQLDEGPIIAQAVVPIDHSYRPEEMAQAGRDVEKIVLAKALKLVFEERVFLNGSRTIVFD